MIRWYRTKLFRNVLLALVFAALLSLTWGSDFVYDSLFHMKRLIANGNEFRGRFLEYGWLAPFIFGTIQILQVVIAPVPGDATGFLGGYLFGVWPSFLYSMIGLTIGSWIAFACGRFLGDLVLAQLRKTKVYQKFNRIVNKGDFVIPFIFFILPGFPKDSLAYLLGLSRMPLGVFLFITGVGRIPSTLLLSLQGANVYKEDYKQFAILLLATAAITLPCFFFRKNLLRWLGRRPHSPENNDPLSLT